MKASHSGYSLVWKPFLGVLLAVCFLATAAHADSLFEGTFTLTHAVRWDNAVLAPGHYSLTLDQSTRTIVIRETATGKIIAREFALPDYFTANDDNSKLLIRVQGEQRVVYAVQLTGLGKVYQKAHPFAAGDRSLEEARNAKTIPVEMAKK